MTWSRPLVSIGLPIRNAAQTVEGVVATILEQTHTHLELVISDNASTDDTEMVCRTLARSDSRVVYHRQREDIGLLANFRFVLSESSGEFFRWIGDDDALHPEYSARCVAVLEQHRKALLTTTRIAYTDPDGLTRSDSSYDGVAMASADPVNRLDSMLGYLNQSYLLVDPLYAMLRRDGVRDIARRNMLREDQLFSTKLALAGPWAHVPELLANRHIRPSRLPALARRLQVPAWQIRVTNSLLCYEILREVDRSGLDERDRRRARAAVARFYRRRQADLLRRRVRRVGSMLTPIIGRG